LKTANNTAEISKDTEEIELMVEEFEELKGFSSHLNFLLKKTVPDVIAP
jgi:hypothetical protein